MSGAFEGHGWAPEQVQTGARKLPEQWTIRLPYPRPPKGLSANDRVHWATKNAATQQVRAEVMAKVRAAKVPALEKCQVDVVWWVADRRRRDADNLAPFAKAIYDGIGADRGISARIVEDDAPEFMVKAAPQIKFMQSVTPHFEIRIREVIA